MYRPIGCWRRNFQLDRLLSRAYQSFRSASVAVWRSRCADFVGRVIAKLLKSSPDVVVVNPPRTGLDPQARQGLLQGRPKEIIYISCQPATLARDLSALQEAGYRLTSCSLYDMFPQTTHVETVARMTL